MVCGLPDVCDVAAVFLAGLVIEDLVLDDVAFSLEAGHDAGVRGDSVAIFSCLESFDEDGVCIAMIRHHEVLIAAAGADREATCVVCVESADGSCP